MSNSGHYGEIPPTLAAQVLDGLPAAVVIMRLDDLNDPTSLRYLYANGPTRDVSGVDPEQAVGRRFVDMDLSEAVLERARVYASVVRSGQPLAMPEFYRESDALCRSGWYSVRLVPLADQCIAFFALNVSERRQAENRVAEQEHFLAAILENLPNMVFVKDAKELKFIRINRAGEQLIGHTREQLLGKDDFDFFPEAQAEFFTEKDRAVLTSGELFDIAEEPIQTARGERWLHTKKVPVVGDGGIPLYLLGISEDITEQRAQNSELQRMKQLAEASSAAKSSFLARMSHEIRTPLSAILGTTELMLESSLTAEQREQLEGAHSAASGLRALLNDILDFEKSAAGKIELRPAYFPPVFHLEDVARMFRPTAAAKGLQLTVSSSAAVPASVRTDPLRLRQILVNLVGNALKFTDSGRIDLHVDAQADVDSTEVTLLYMVSDTGIGIHESQQGFVFDAFRQADETTTRAHT
ncbi:MAG: PAS domain S-box protein, partial [Myxococcales bacterium]|nr:PAS domain S-box protein [Myxococcales bacterium]